MPAEYIIDAERGIVFSRGVGTVTDDDLQQHAAKLKADPAFKASFRQFADFSEVKELRITSGGIASIAGKANPFGPDAIRAAYAPQDLIFGMARMFATMHEASSLLVTRDRAAAERHLGLAAGESEKVFQR